jgi:hypothetical protein
MSDPIMDYFVAWYLWKATLSSAGDEVEEVALEALCSARVAIPMHLQDERDSRATWRYQLCNTLRRKMAALTALTAGEGMPHE